MESARSFFTDHSEGTNDEEARSKSPDWSLFRDVMSVGFDIVGSMTRRSSYCLWKREVTDARITRSNLLQIPQEVVLIGCLQRVRCIDIVDGITGDTYQSEVHTFKRAGNTEKYLGGGWNRFARNMGLCNGDLVGFSIRYPHAEQIVVTVLNIDHRGW